MNIEKIDKLAQQWVEAHSHKWSNNNGEVGDNYGSFVAGYQTAEKELQKQLITEIMNDDAKDGLYEPQPTWDDVRKAIELARKEVKVPYEVRDGHAIIDYCQYSEEEIIEQLKQSKT